MLTEELVEKLTPEKVDEGSDDVTPNRNQVLEAIATVCMNQRQYHLATKKYTQAGNRIKVHSLYFIYSVGWELNLKIHHCFIFSIIIFKIQTLESSNNKCDFMHFIHAIYLSEKNKSS